MESGFFPFYGLVFLLAAHINYLRILLEYSMLDGKTVKALMTGILNDDEAEVTRIVDACLEAEYRSQLEATSRAVFESMASRQKPVMG